jgi:DNA-binding transcriptional ArsR family regulator/NAD-dependent dihydropyrimidine dehydrogenase PreA subunit
MNYYEHLANIMRALAHPARLEILAILARQPACVNTLVSLSGHRQANVSQHLSLLREAGLVSFSRMGRRTRYALARPLVMQLIAAARKYLEPGLMESGEVASEREQWPITWYGIRREQIEWHPAVVVERCTGCGLCVITCDQGVLAFDQEQNIPVVAAPDMCPVGCTTCATICVQDALEFPHAGYLRQAIRQNKLLSQAKDLLYAVREKVDIKSCQNVMGAMRLPGAH